MVGEIFDTGEGSEVPAVLRGTWADLLVLDPSAAPDRWEIRPDDGVALRAFTTSLEQATNGALSTYTLEDTTADEEFLLFLSVVAFMGAVLVAISLGGVLNTVLLETRQRTRELALLKAVGLTPRQVVALVISTVAPLALLAGLVGVPLGLLSQRAVLGYMGQIAADTAIPEVSFDVFPPLLLVALACSGLAIAVAGAYVPAQRAARARIAPALQAE
jgi:putative ABC transport system permease protein